MKKIHFFCVIIGFFSLAMNSTIACASFYLDNVEDFEGGTIPMFFSFDGNAEWRIDWVPPHHIPTFGAFAARAGGITHSQTSSMLLDEYSFSLLFLGAQSISAVNLQFAYRVSCEPIFDNFNFFIDGTLALSESGEIPWSLFSVSLTPDPHELKWQYRKDSTLSSGWDTVWIDNITVTTVPYAPVPVPATILLFGTGLAGLVGSRIRRKKKA